jgi:hypothetical protein
MNFVKFGQKRFKHESEIGSLHPKQNSKSIVRKESPRRRASFLFRAYVQSNYGCVYYNGLEEAV